MTDLPNTKPPVWFWIIAVIALIWNAMGVMQYLAQAYMTDDFKSQYTAEQLEMINNTPAWATAAFAIAVFAGLLGSLLLILKRRFASTLFSLSLLGIVLQLYHNLIVIDTMEIIGPIAGIMSGIILIFGILILLFSKMASRKGWLR
ncbi:hypothetical protein [Psychroserpens sp. S379A]|uniref:hypothetical protein n=1 Tax=Psychroserpens sp. S379A TaxID=3415137 RepID=UPI003C7A8957